MSDPALSNHQNAEEVLETNESPKQSTQRASMFSDPVVRVMIWAAFGIVILYLAGIVGALAFGVLGTAAPRTAPERQVDFTYGVVQAGDHSSKALGAYADALIDVGQYAKAQNVIDTAPQSARGTASGDIEVSQARLYLARKNYAAAITAADVAQKVMKAQYQIDLKKPGTTVAKAYGLDANYYNALLIKAIAQQASGDYRGAVTSYSAYLDKNPMESNVLVDRAEAKLKLNDTAGAKADYQAALRYVPDNARALDGLKKIGAQ